MKGLKIGGVGTITATADINPEGIRKVYDLWIAGEEAQSNADVIRKIVFKYPLAPTLKTIHSVYRSDPGWHTVRPPLTELNVIDTENLINELDSVGFKLAL